MNLPSIIMITGTDTGVGKTITTAALASVLSAPLRTPNPNDGVNRAAAHSPAPNTASLSGHHANAASLSGNHANAAPNTASLPGHHANAAPNTASLSGDHPNTANLSGGHPNAAPNAAPLRGDYPNAASPGRVAIYKPCQTGAAIGDSDIAEITRLSGALTSEAGSVLQEPLAPKAAAAVDGVTLPSVTDHIARITELATSHDHVLVEGAGGLLVELDQDGGTLADLALELMGRGAELGFVVVARAGLGTLNHTSLTMEALAHRGLPVLGLVVGSTQDHPGPAELDNLAIFGRGQLPGHGMTAMLGAIPAGASQLPPDNFQAQAKDWLGALATEVTSSPEPAIPAGATA
ncbi:AAA family ATPase [Arthrobacter sp. M4]|uniref:AAA family ATPase n=1 Tax=Arthrobacter sp. M4 TaxID=218160 RepID=UPI001CDB5A22|nr:AAA family ATPase [Arthrobacter sp. M4]MCA4133938.1 AAA family ATPase [Arthrobacter sp. M4]